MRFRALLLLLAAIILGSLAAFLVNSVVTRQVTQQEVAAPPTGIPAVVAATDLTVGLSLEAVHLRVVELPADAYPAGAYTSIAQLLAEQPPIVLAEMRTGEVLLPFKLSTGVELRGLTTRIPDGMRAVSIPVNEVRGVGGFVLPGDRVDVLHTTSIGRRDEQPVTRTLMQDMLVLGVDQTSAQTEESAIVVNVVTLLAEPEQAKTLTLAQQVGDLTLMLRNEGDRGQDGSATVALDDLWTFGPEDLAPRRSAAPGQGGAAAPSATVANRREVQIIRGLEIREEVVGPDGVPVAPASPAADATPN